MQYFNVLHATSSAFLSLAISKSVFWRRAEPRQLGIWDAASSQHCSLNYYCCKSATNFHVMAFEWASAQADKSFPLFCYCYATLRRQKITCDRKRFLERTPVHKWLQMQSFMIQMCVYDQGKIPSLTPWIASFHSGALPAKLHRSHLFFVSFMSYSL